jgi:tripartite-type tricarboxylate transporter receptor subunit TctC
MLSNAIRAGLMLALAAAGATAQDYPAKQITLVMPFAAGGPTCRCQYLSSMWCSAS